VGIADCYGESAPDAHLLAKYGLDALSVTAAALEMLARPVAASRPSGGGTSCST
jgi:hypothetical protein